MAEAKPVDRMEKLVALCKRRGFIYPGSEIYGGLNGFWDYGPLGVELKRNVKDAWWHDMVTVRDDIVGLDSAIIMNPKVWEASGHVTGFNDPRVDCRACKARLRADQVFVVGLKRGWDGAPNTAGLTEELAVLNAEIEEHVSKGMSRAEASELPAIKRYIEGLLRSHYRPDYVKTVIADSEEEAGKQINLTKAEKKLFGDVKPCNFTRLSALYQSRSLVPDLFPEPPCPICGKEELTPPRQFNLMFQTYVGAMEDASSLAYLRPETAQGIFVNYKNVLDTMRVKLPFGIAQIGKAFRNEINPRNYTFRSREFEQMEIEFFCRPEEAARWYEYWRDARFQWYVSLGLTSAKLRLREHEADELAHYAKSCADVEYDFPFGINELEGVANRTDYDLRRHQEFSGKDLTYFDDQTKERFLPFVVEPSAGVDRSVLAFLCEAYTEDVVAGEARTLMRFHPRLAPIKAAVFPLVNRENMPDIARRMYDQLKRHLPAFYDDKGAIGRRYRRQDEAGTPYCFTIDSQTLQDGTVTVRQRDTLQQDRIHQSQALQYLRDHLRADDAIAT